VNADISARPARVRPDGTRRYADHSKAASWLNISAPAWAQCDNYFKQLRLFADDWPERLLYMLPISADLTLIWPSVLDRMRAEDSVTPERARFWGMLAYILNAGADAAQQQGLAADVVQRAREMCVTAEQKKDYHMLQAGGKI
jgi:hypothetical protein